MAFLSTDYTDRAVDINIFGRDTDPQLRTAPIGLGLGSMVAGPYKEAQKFLRILLSDKGTLLGQPNYGTDFFKKLYHGVIMNEAQFRVYFASAKATALSFMYSARRVEGVADPRFKDDEKIVDVPLYSLVVNPGEAVATFKFTFIDEDTNIIIPVGIPVGT